MQRRINLMFEQWSPIFMPATSRTVGLSSVVLPVGPQRTVFPRNRRRTGLSPSARRDDVWCTGCKAAFEEDPERWIAKWEARLKAMKKPE